jgi:hypothetical protein
VPNLSASILHYLKKEIKINIMNNWIKRRSFLKSTASAVAGCLAASCTQPPLSSGNDLKFPEDVNAQNSIIDQTAVDETLDTCAVTLAQENSSKRAWATLFQKPSGKTWQEVKAAIKVNEVGRNLPRIAIIHKVCRELNLLGIPFGNIRIYGGPNDTVTNITAYNRLMVEMLPSGIVVSQHDSELGGTKEVPIPEAHKDDKTITSTTCVAEIADNTNDILINVAVNKGHWEEFGGFTLSMKNHFGTFSPRPYPGASFSDTHANLDYLCSISKSDVLVGSTPPQQQLCIVDSIWATTMLNPGVNGDDIPANMIIMGVFSPVVDYVTARKVRKNIMGCYLSAVADTFLLNFGYTEREIRELDLLLISDSQITSLTAGKHVPIRQLYKINPRIPDERVVCCFNSGIVNLH